MGKNILKKLNNNRLKLILILTLIIVLIISILFITGNKQKVNSENEIIREDNKKSTNEIGNEVNIEENKVENNETEEIENTDVQELKKATGVTGDSDIYEIQTEFEGQKILAVKKSVRFKVAFAGMIKKDISQQTEVNEIFNNNYSNKKGIWVENNSKEKVLELFNAQNSNKYYINSEGYLQVKDRDSQSEIDKKIEKAISGNKTIILDVSSICHIVDDMTGKILDYNFEENDKYQTHEYFEDDNSLIIFITENKENQVDKNKILNNIVQLF